MATFRVGIGSFNIKDGAVGIGTELSGFGNLKVEGTVKSDQFDVIESGISTFTRYSGFSANKVEIKNRSTTLSGENQILSDVVVDNSTFTVGLGSTSSIGEIGYACVKHHFSVPTGDTNFRNEVSGYGEGTIRYNTDLETLEFFNGSEWKQFTYNADISNSPSTRGRALKGCGRTFSPSVTVKVIEFVNIASQGNSENFGDCSIGNQSSSFSSSIRGFFNGQNYNDVMEYVTIASGGDSIDFGNLTVAGALSQGGSSSTRGITSGGWGPSRLNVIDYVEMMTLGDAIDFGDLARGVNAPGATNNSIRKLILGGRTPSVLFEEIMMINIASKGNAVDVGTWTQEVMEPNCGNISSGTRGISAGSGPNISDISPLISSIQIDSMGKAIEFGDLKTAKRATAGASSLTRGLIMGGTPDDDGSNDIEFITIASAGNGQDFGDLIMPTRDCSGLSDCHGGLGGY
tara:strand:+ start:27 stop:1403 length:1377 start_codon:yes stop_codon:yes gene_type:complete